MIVALLMIKIVLVVEKTLLCSRWARVLVLEGWIFLLGGCDHDGGIVDVIQRHCFGGDDNDVVPQ